ncbi:hypothetical protein KUTeg_001416 [Tegillarca granosa]|uniref:Uncharacterized protein n=1 Tax=Tegillarca granosa TaxID=220873 RepID=A0ABQ9FRD0_TEGGR|nr:hypothetical protein KUTeg_001416 [Tegillarca granosa]
MSNYNVKPKSDRNISLTLTSKYASSWGTWEGIRELVQNWHDGVFDVAVGDDTSAWFDQKLMFKQIDQEGCHFISYVHNQRSGEDINIGCLIFDKISEQLVLINSGTALKKKILLLGFSAKSNKHEVIGQFGEGLKVGALALVRNGFTVVMETDTDQWKFDLMHNKEFEESVLTVIVTDRIKDFSYGKICLEQQHGIELSESDTCTIVGGLTFQEWKKFLPRFLFLKPPECYVNTELGTLLLDTELAGQLYVKGLWVADLTESDLSAGVSFSSLQLDRDRNAVPKPSEIDHLMSAIWIKSLEKNPSLIKRYFHLVQNEKITYTCHLKSSRTPP